MRPVLAGMWKQHETFDGTYILDDLIEINTALDIKAEEENKRRVEMEGRKE